MGKIIAIWGNPGAGRTAFAAKLVKALYRSEKAKIICIFTDNQTPVLPVLFPNSAKESLPSIGALMSKTQIDKRDMLKYLVTFKSMKNVGFLGYADGENRFTYPEFSKEKAINLIDTISSVADYIIVDCSGDLNESLNYAAIQRAESLFKLCSPTLKGVSYFSSQLPLYGDAVFKPENYIAGIVATESEKYMPLNEAKQHFGNIRFAIPYCGELQRQFMEGGILDDISDKKWNERMNKITRMVT